MTTSSWQINDHIFLAGLHVQVPLLLGGVRAQEEPAGARGTRALQAAEVLPLRPLQPSLLVRPRSHILSRVSRRSLLCSRQEMLTRHLSEKHNRRVDGSVIKSKDFSCTRCDRAFGLQMELQVTWDYCRYRNPGPDFSSTRTTVVGRRPLPSRGPRGKPWRGAWPRRHSRRLRTRGQLCRSVPRAGLLSVSEA